MQRRIDFLLLTGAFLGLGAVGFGAYAEHHLHPLLDSKTFHAVEIALQYQLLHAVLICGLALVLNSGNFVTKTKRLRLAGWLFAIGTCAFSFSIEAAATCGNVHLQVLAPAGGFTLMAAWGTLAAAAF